jgi:AraC-like DNA-binding protein
MICLDISWCKAFQESLWDTKLDTFEKINNKILKDKKMHASFIGLSILLRDRSVFYLEKEAALHEFMETFFERNTSDTVSNNTQDIPLLDHLESAKEYIKQNVRENITVAELAKKASLSEYHFMRVFKHYTGMSPHAYLINQKINLAQKLLLSGAPIIDVALELGFVDQSHLNRHFRPIVTMSPGEFIQAAGVKVY